MPTEVRRFDGQRTFGLRGDAPCPSGAGARSHAGSYELPTLGVAPLELGRGRSLALVALERRDEESSAAAQEYVPVPVFGHAAVCAHAHVAAVSAPSPPAEGWAAAE